MGHIKLNFRGRSRSKCEIVLSVIICLISIGSARATDYYFSNGGSDSNSGNSPGSAWATVSKMQQTINTLGPGDRILLERGSVWYEVTLNFSSRNGTAANPICFEAYGEGDRPKLSGGKVINDFVQTGNIYSATIQSSFPRGHILVPAGILIDGKAPDIARSEEFFTQGTNSWTQLVDAKQTWNTNELVGGIVIFQPVLWSWSASPISENTSNALTFTKAQYYLSNGKWMAYYLANLDQYLNSDGDWTFKNNTLKIYSSDDLAGKNVQFGMADTIIAASNSSNILIKDIAFELANYRLLSFVNGSNISVVGCDLGYSGGTGLKAYRTSYMSVKESYVHDIAAMGILIDQCDYAEVRSNLFKRISARRIGLSNYTFRFGAAVSNLAPGVDSHIEYNYFDSVGLAIQSHTFRSGITGSYSYNYIQNHGVTIADCAAIYCASDYDATPKTIKKNIIKNAITSGYRYTAYGDMAINPHPVLHPHAVYIDEGGLGYKCDSNSIENVSTAFFTNRSHSNAFTHTNVVDANMDNPDRYNAVYLKDQAIGPTHFSADRDEVKNNNIVLSDRASSLVYLRHTSTYVSEAPDANNFYFDNNKIANPFRSSTYIGRFLLNWGSTEASYSLEQMQNNTDNVNVNVSDLNTVIDPQGIKFSQVAGQVNQEDFVKFFTNFSNSVRSVDLGSAVFKDIDGNTVTGTTTVEPFYSKILFYVSGDINSVEAENYIDSTLVPFLSEVYGQGTVEEAGNQKPNINSASFNILESNFVSTYIGEIGVTDPDAGQDHTYSIQSGNEEGLFSINNNGELYFTTDEPDFTGDPVYGLVVRVEDNGVPVLTDEALVTVSLFADEGEANLSPVIEPQAFEASYDMELPTLIGVVDASDPNAGQELSYSITSGNQEDLFSLGTSSGELRIVHFPQSQLPGSYDIIVRVEDNGQESMYAEAVMTINISASAMVFYIDPDKAGDSEADGTYEHPYSSWQQVEWIEGGTYLQKKGTQANENKILILASDVKLGDYGTGDKPVINSEASDYAIKVMEKGNVRIHNLKINADGAIGCIYFIGASCIDNEIVNCELSGADYGLRIIDGDSYVVKYNVIQSNVDGIYSIADFAEIYYNIFKGNHKAVNLSSYSASAQIYNNVFYDNRQAVSTSYAELSIMNNIFYLTQPGDQAINHALDKLVSNHNIFYPEQTGFIQVEEVSYSTLDEYRNKYGLDLNSFTQDPLFVDVYNDNFTVEPGSKAIDGGRLVGLLEDFFGHIVPSGSAPDIGLMEVDNPTGLGSDAAEEDFDLQVFPNPTNGVFTVTYTNNLIDDAEVSVFTLSGSVIFTEPIDARGAFSTLVDITDFPQGVYYVTVKTHDGFINRKIIKD